MPYIIPGSIDPSQLPTTYNVSVDSSNLYHADSAINGLASRRDNDFSSLCAFIDSAVKSTVDQTMGGAMLKFARGRYKAKRPVVWNSRVYIDGPGVSHTLAASSNPVSIGLFLAAIETDPSFAANQVLMTWDEPNLMLDGCGISNIVVDASATYAKGNIDALRFGNLTNLYLDKVLVVKPARDAVVIDNAGFVPSFPSISQLWLDKLEIWQPGRHGVNFPGSPFIGQVYIRNFWILQPGTDGIFQVAPNNNGTDMQIGPGTIQNAQNGMTLGQGEMNVQGVTVFDCFNNGIYVKSTQAFGYKSIIANCIIRDPDRNLNASAGIKLDTGTTDYILYNNVVEKVNRTPEIGIQIVDGFDDILGNYVDRTNRVVGAFTTATYKFGATSFQTVHPPDPGFVTATPAFPATNVDVANNNPYPVEIIMLTTGTTTAFQITDPSGTAQAVTSGLFAGQGFALGPGSKIRFTFTVAPTWKWYGVRG